MTKHLEIYVPYLADGPLDAAREFYKQIVPTLRRPAGMDWPEPPELLAERSVTIVFPSADHTHRAWRLAAVQELAREVAPMRFNAIAGDDEAAVREACAYLQGACGVTGQLLSVQSG